MTGAGDSALPDLTKPHPFSVHDMVRMERLGDPKPAPDGKWILFTRETWDPEADKTTTNLWLVSSDGESLRQLTSARHVSDTSPVWSPDGRTVAFVSNRSKKKQIWTIRQDGGEARQLTDLPVDVANLRWSPAGSHLSFTGEVYPDAADIYAAAERDKARAESPKAMTFDRLFIRQWDAWFDGKWNHIFVLPVSLTAGDTEWKAAGPPLDLLKGIDADAPTRPFGGAEEYDWSPDGTEIAYTTKLSQDAAWSTDVNIYLVPVGGGKARCITSNNHATDARPLYSPDGRTIAYLSMARPGFEADRYRIKLYDRQTGKTRILTEEWDRSPEALAWSPEGKTLFVTAQEHGRMKIFAVDVANGRPRELLGEHFNRGLGVTSASPAGGERILVGQDALTGPKEIWSARNDGSDLRRLTHVNDDRITLAQVSMPDEFWFSGALGDRVHAWILKPVPFDAEKRYPIAFIIHGGPQGAVCDQFRYQWNLQVFAGAGYAVLAINFHGSTGFGQAFTDSISGDWGEKPFEDLMKGLDYALTAYKWLEPGRVGALGASFGGWMINWINGQTNRFKCLVNHAGIFDISSFYYTTDELWWPEWDVGGVPWENPAVFQKFSPMACVANWQTPTLVIHGGKDYRIVDAGGIATFTALQRKKIPSQLLYFPDEGHWVLNRKNSIVWYETVIGWLDQWLKS